MFIALVGIDNMCCVMCAVLPELDLEGWTSDDFVRDMPVDYTLLVENLLDPGVLLTQQKYDQLHMLASGTARRITVWVLANVHCHLCTLRA